MTGSPTQQFAAAATILAVRDLLQGVAHYRDVLGFRVVFMYGEPTYYAILERDEVSVHLVAADEAKRQPGQGAIYVFVHDVDALYLELRSRGALIVKEPRDYPYGMRDFDLHDPDGNHLSFGMESKPQ